MGALSAATSIIPTLTGVLSTVRAAENIFGTANQRRSDNQAVKQLQDRQRQAELQSAQQAELDRTRISTEAAQDEERRRSALRRAVARQRAQFGSSGITSSSGGSSEAVLLGLFDETEDEINRRTQLDNLRNNVLDIGLAQQRSVNVLQATQLAERQNLNRLF